MVSPANGRTDLEGRRSTPVTLPNGGYSLKIREKFLAVSDWADSIARMIQFGFLSEEDRVAGTNSISYFANSCQSDATAANRGVRARCLPVSCASTADTKQRLLLWFVEKVW
jgi:hypothetical protein